MVPQLIASPRQAFVDSRKIPNNYLSIIIL
jgi:hypothetical protein